MPIDVLASFALLLGGLVAYLPTSRRFMQGYQGRYGGIPPRRWMFRSVDDPEIERWRRYAAASLLLNLIGVALVFATSVSR